MQRLKDEFRAYYSPTKDELNRLWSEAVLVFDTNALLNLFRYSASTRDEWIDLLKTEKDRLWLPHQVGLEFHRNRRLIASQEEKAFADVDRALDNAAQTVRASIDRLRRHPTSEADELSEVLERHLRKVRKKFKRARARHFEAVIEQEAHDNTLEIISELYEGKVGKPYSTEDLEALYKEGGERYSKSIPPGYMDAADKPGVEKFGDLVLWRQILDYSRVSKRPLIFVTDDAKEDWWLKSGSRTLGPRPELVEEHFNASGERAHFYQPRAFLKFAKERGQKISDGALAEARKVSEVRARESLERLRAQIADVAGVREAADRLARADLARQFKGFSTVDVPGLRAAAEQLAQLGQVSPYDGFSRNGLMGAADLLGSEAASRTIAALASQAATHNLIYDAFLQDEKRIRSAQEMDAQREPEVDPRELKEDFPDSNDEGSGDAPEREQE